MSATDETQEVKLVVWTPTTELAQKFPEFGKLDIYGTSDVPLFSLPQVAEMIGVRQIRPDHNLDKGEDYVKLRCPTKNSKHMEQNLLTEQGLYIVIGRGRNELSKKFMRFVYIVIRELRLKGSVTAAGAVSKLDEYEKKIVEYKTIVDEEHKKYVDQVAFSEKYQVRNYELQLKYECAIARNKLKETPATAEYQLEKLKQKYFRPAYVYMVPLPKEMKDQVETYDVKEDYDCDEDERVWTLSFSRKEKEPIAEVLIPPKMTLEEIDKQLEAVKLKDKKGRYHCSLTMLREQLDELI